MNTLLLKAIRYSKVRLDKSIANTRTKNPLKEYIFQYLRILAPLSEIPLVIDDKCRFYLDGPISPNTKTGIAFREITKSGIHKDRIWHASLSPKTTLKKVLRVIYRFPWFICFLLNNFRIFKVLDLSALQVLLGYEAYKRFFHKHPNLIPIILSDISPLLHMQWSAALALNRNVLWWQDDYHHHKNFSDENYMPYPAAIAVVLNQKGLKTVLGKNLNAQIYRRTYTKVHSFKPLPKWPRLGIATNATFQASSEQLQYLDKIRKNFGVKKIYFRLHPNSKLTIKELNKSWIGIAPTNEELEGFIQRIDLVLVGNSAVQLKLLCLGIPVIHIAGLDSFGFDLYGYCREGFCYGIKDRDCISLEKVSKFYENSIIGNRLNKFMNVQSEIPSLLELAI